VEYISEILDKPVEWSVSEAVKSAFAPPSQTVGSEDLSRGSVTPWLEPAQKPPKDARCLWCGRDFKPRSTGGSAQKFCCTGHRQQFWIAARRWTMRAIEAGLLSVDCLKASQRACTLPEGHSATRDTPMAEHIRAVRSEYEMSSVWAPASEDPDERWFGLSLSFSVKQFETQAVLSFAA
jgi:hypothetical protein